MKIQRLLILLILFSCNSNRSRQGFKISEISELDLVYYSLIKAELKENYLITVIDEIDEITTIQINGFKPMFDNKSEIFYFNKLMFPEMKYINKDSFILYMNSKKEDNLELSDFKIKYKSNKVLNLLVPLINEEDKVIVELRHINPIKKSVHTWFYVLEKEEGVYKIINKRIGSVIN